MFPDAALNGESGPSATGAPGSTSRATRRRTPAPAGAERKSKQPCSSVAPSAHVAASRTCRPLTLTGSIVGTGVGRGVAATVAVGLGGGGDGLPASALPATG